MKTSNPVFIFSAGWRSGSTMLQRLISSSGEVLVWGEAGGGISGFLDAYERYRQMLGPGSDLYMHGYGGNGEQQFSEFLKHPDDRMHRWIACMNPGHDHLLASMRQFFVSYYEDIAMDLGYGRWGVKEVQSGIDVAKFVKLLFPDARIIFLVRHPYKCILSIKRRKWMDMEHHKDPLKYYANYWKRLAREFYGNSTGLLVKYEDLISDRSVYDEVVRYAQVSEIPDDFVLSSKADWKADTDDGLTLMEKVRLRMIAGEEMKLFGYK
jgi:hypothetical protein